MAAESHGQRKSGVRHYAQAVASTPADLDPDMESAAVNHLLDVEGGDT